MTSITTSPAYTIADLIDSYSDLLHYVREDAEMHLVAEYDEDDDLCPTKLADRRQAIYDDGGLWRILKAAPQMLEALKFSVTCPDEDEALRVVEAAIATSEQ